MNNDKIVILNDFKHTLTASLKDNLKDVILFGSQLTDKTNRDSDFDILIVLKQKLDWKGERDISDLCYEIDLKYGILSDTHILSDEDFNSLRGKQPIFVNALKNGMYA
jgi:predicted nucleotidyltransferase